MTAKEARELATEMNTPVFTTVDEARPFVVVRKDYEEGSSSLWREYERFETEDEARKCLRQIRDNQNAREDETGEEPMMAYKMVEVR